MPLSPGDPAPWFKAPTPSQPEFVFDTAAGRYVVLLFLPLDVEGRRQALTRLAAARRLFDDTRVSAFVVARDEETLASARDLRGLRWFLDAQGDVCRLYGALEPNGAERPHWLLLDPTLRVMAAGSLSRLDTLLQGLPGLRPPGDHAGVPVRAPVLVAPRVFEPEVCRELVALHGGGGAFTGVMRDQGQRTVLVMDELKRRRDVYVEDAEVQAALRERLERRLFPMIERALGVRPTRIERYVVSCYDAADQGVFHPHRDNTTFGTAHRAFACSINLNDDFEGGDLRFPEYGPATYRPPVGGAVVFSCSLLHEATRVTRGQRYAFLPFFYDEAGGEVLAAYRARSEQTEPAA
ncbi:2OG-Fe(II) oxygenase [Phenylobacterium sp.]|jgi:predicted 2-oxoglutarate/Fe(II)-dependent dioxygenase YbiX/peroxiredoxin|uniref:2OG-Fe(II) oxygenase n=1 Tax=Phenylobacterium sp. TaxID=1871053 RepID=UPI002F947D45